MGGKGGEAVLRGWGGTEGGKGWMGGGTGGVEGRGGRWKSMGSGKMR